MCLFGCGCCRCSFSYLNVVSEHSSLAANSANLFRCPAILPYTMISYLFTASLEIFYRRYRMGARPLRARHLWHTWAAPFRGAIFLGRIILFLDQPNRREHTLGWRYYIMSTLPKILIWDRLLWF